MESWKRQSSKLDMAMMLPLESLSLYAASQEQIIESRIRTFAAWGRGTTLQQYLDRDAKTDRHIVSRDNRLTTWVLARRQSPESIDFLCSCETFRRDGLVARASPGGSGPNNVERVNCYGIASVFTPEWNRGKGYARHMMRLLHWVIGRREALPLESFPAEWGSPPVRPHFTDDGEFSVLYSDIGPRFYFNAGPTLAGNDGWQVREPISTMWDVGTAHELLAQSSQSTGQMKWTWLDTDKVNDAFEADARFMERELMTQSLSRPITFTYLPTRGVAEFQYQRLSQFWSNITPDPPAHWGICVYTEESNASDSIDVSAFASWTIDYRPPVMNRLIITRLRSSPENFPALLFQIVDYAKRHSIAEVEIWSLPHNLREMAERWKGRNFDRDDEHSLSSFKWYGEGDLQDVAF